MFTGALQKLKFRIGSTKSKDEHFTHYYKVIIEHSSKQSPPTLRFENNKSWDFFFNNIELLANQFELTEVINKNHRWIYHFYQNRYDVANICERFDSTYDV